MLHSWAKASRRLGSRGRSRVAKLYNTSVGRSVVVRVAVAVAESASISLSLSLFLSAYLRLVVSTALGESARPQET